jgi:SAM-dependent methyltransferase
LARFRRLGGAAPLSEISMRAGETGAQAIDPHYILQASWAARRIRQSDPCLHTDVGSQVMFVVMLSSFVPVEYLDLRPIPLEVPGLVQRAGDITRLPIDGGSLVSISCLHVIEHVGLGRYGDGLDPGGSAKAASELARVLAREGRLYVSCPVGRERVVFNAHRVFSPAHVVSLFDRCTLEEFSFVDDRGVLHENASLPAGEGLEYGCGLFVFRGGACGSAEPEGDRP